jgi:putative membrane protein
MTSASEQPPAELRRLHPLSWLFVLLAQLRQFALPLIALLFFGRGGDWQEAAAAISAIGLSLLAVWHYFTYTYRVDADALVIRSGLLQRGVRHLPFQRIHNVELRRSPLHRIFRVAELRIESATGDKSAEAQMQVLALADAEALVARVRRARAPLGAVTDEDAVGAPEAVAILASVPVRDLILLGLSNNRGWVIVGAAFGVLVQLDQSSWWRAMPGAFAWVRDGLQAVDPGFGAVLSGLLLLLIASLLLRILGVGLELLRHYGFRLSEADTRLSVECGLLTRTQSHTSRGKVQRWVVREPWLLRRFDRRALHVETAARQTEGAERGIDALLPVAPAARIDALLRRFLPGIRWEGTDWKRIHPRAWRRMIKPPLVLLVLLCAVATLHLGQAGLLLLLLAPLLVLAIRRGAAFSAWSADAERVLWRSGWLQRRWQIIERERVQCVRLRQSWLDRHARMAHVDIDSAGARSGAITTLGYLPEDDARRLVRRLRRWLSAPRLLAPEGGREQHEHGEHFETAEQHAERAQPDGAVAYRSEGTGDLTETRTEVGHGGNRAAEGRKRVEAESNHAEHQRHEADHPQGDESADRKHHAL